MKYDFNKVQDRIGSDSIKWEKQLKFGTRTGLLPFWIADTDFATLPEAVEAMKKRLNIRFSVIPLPERELWKQ